MFTGTFGRWRPCWPICGKLRRTWLSTAAIWLTAGQRTPGWPGVRENTDEMLWSPKSLTEFAARTPQLGAHLGRIQDLIPPTLASIGDERLRWLEGFPERYVVEGITLVHASPGDLWRAPMPNTSDEELRSTYAALNSAIAVY